MNRLADAMEPYLTASGIRFSRNTPEMTAVSSIQASNAGTYDLHLALHSNAAPEGKYGQVRGILAFYYPGSVQGQKAANLIANGLKTIYPLPNLVRAQATTTIGEVRRVRAPAVFLELGYHDNPDDAAWVKNNLGAIARNIVLSLTEYFGLPFLEPQSPGRRWWMYPGATSTSGTPLPSPPPCWPGPTTAPGSPSSTSGKTGTWCASTAWWAGPAPTSSP